MSNWNGFVSSLTRNGSTVSQTMGATAVAYSQVADAVPGKYFSSGQFAVATTQGVSGAFFVNVVGAVGGATFVIAGRTAVNAVGGFPIPLILYVGSSGSVPNRGFPKPAYVQWGSAGAVIGFTAAVYLAGEYSG
jgi:hypothetical protein